MTKTKALIKYIEEKWNVKIVKIKHRKLCNDCYIICDEYEWDTMDVCYYLRTNHVFRKLSDIVDYLGGIKDEKDI